MNEGAAGCGSPPPATEGRSIVDFGAVGRRLRVGAGLVFAMVPVVWLIVGLFGDGGLTLRGLAELFGVAVAVMMVIEVVIVGAAAARGMLRAGERGDRLAGSDVSLLPPQLRRRRR